jgi:hypothetical protein
VRSWDASLPPSIPSGCAGILPLTATLQSEVGPEVTLALIEPSEFAHKIRALRPLELKVNGALLDTPYGPLICLLWWFPPLSRAGPFALYENALDPYDREMMSPYQLLAAQSHWHLLLFGADRRVAGLWEFRNDFRVDAALANFVSAATRLSPRTDFAKSKRHFYENWKLLDLFGTLVKDSC